MIVVVGVMIHFLVYNVFETPVVVVALHCLVIHWPTTTPTGWWVCSHAHHLHSCGGW